MQLGPYFQHNELRTRRENLNYEKWNFIFQSDQSGPSSPSKGGGVPLVIGDIEKSRLAKYSLEKSLEFSRTLKEGPPPEYRWAVW